MGRHLQRGEALIDLGRYSEAAGEFSKELAENPDCALAYAMRAISLANARGLVAAEESARRAIELAPEWEYGYYSLSVVKWFGKDFAASEVAVRNALALGRSEYSLAHLAEVLNLTDRHAEALEVARECLMMNPRNIDAIIAHASALVILDKTKINEARKILTDALTIHPNNPLLHKITGILDLQSANYSEALASLREARRLDPVRYGPVNYFVSSRQVASLACDLR